MVLLFYVGFPPLPSFFVKILILEELIQYSSVVGGLIFFGILVFFRFFWGFVGFKGIFPLLGSIVVLSLLVC